MAKLQLYVWTEFNPDYNDGLALAIASSEDEAKTLVKDLWDFTPHDWGNLEILSLDQPIARAVDGSA